MNGFKWFDHVIRREKMEVVRTVVDTNVQGSGRRSIKRWLGAIKNVMKTAGVCVDGVRDQKKI